MFLDDVLFMPSQCFLVIFPGANQLNRAADEAELYRYVMQSFQLFEQTVASKVMQSTAHRVTLGDAESAGETTEGPPDPQELADAMVSAWATIHFEALEEVVDR